MSYISEQQIIEDLKEIMGPNFEPTQELVRMLITAYKLGRQDTLEFLGIDESDLGNDGDVIAWTA